MRRWVSWVLFSTVSFVAVIMGFERYKIVTAQKAYLQLPSQTLYLKHASRVQVLHVRVAQTPAQQERGLGYLKALDSNTGLYFPFAKLQRAVFWMKGMYFPIDIIWLQHTKVVGVEENIPPPSFFHVAPLRLYYAPDLVDAVLEMRAGFVKEHDIRVGDVLK